MANLCLMMSNLDSKTCVDILTSNYIGYMSYINKGLPYVIPITYFYSEKDSAIICYSGKGHKITSMRQNNQVALVVSDIESPELWQSVQVHGHYEELEGSTARVYLHDFSLGIKKIAFENEGRDMDFISEFSSKIYKDEIPIVFVIRIESMTGKIRSRLKMV